MTNPRKPQHTIDPIFVRRWSTRAFDSSTMPETDLFRLFEAARWAPSAYNVQPWRFIYALRGTSSFEQFVDLLVPVNARWAKSASALVFVLSDTKVDREDGTQSPSSTYAFDTGAACAQLALQAPSLGYQAHVMAGIHADKAAQTLGVPERLTVQVAIAIGKPAPSSVLPKALQSLETPSQRLPIDRIAMADRFSA